MCRGGENSPRDVNAATSITDAAPRPEILADVSTYMTASICCDMESACCDDTGDFPTLASAWMTVLSVLKSL